jgi:replicative DNA helicase
VLSDLRESGAIEQDADLVAFIYRPDYYDPMKSQDIAGETFIKVAKHRNGTLEKIKLIAKLHVQKFYDPNDERIEGGKLTKPAIANAADFKTNDFSEGVPETKYKF